MNLEELAHEAGEGSRAAVELLFHHTYPDVFRLIHWKTKDYHLAWDLTQEALLKMVRNLRTYDPDLGPFRPWMIRVALNTVNDYFRSKAYQQKAGEEVLGADLGSGDLLETVLLREESRELLRSVHTLPEAQREALLLKFIHGLTFREIGEVLGVSEATIKSRVRLGLEKLKTRLGGEPNEERPSSRRTGDR